jgi:hypothetical protein
LTELKTLEVTWMLLRVPCESGARRTEP